MKETEMDAIVAAKLGCSPSYVQRVRRTPDEFDTELVKSIRRELKRVRTAVQRSRRQLLAEISL